MTQTSAQRSIRWSWVITATLGLLLVPIVVAQVETSSLKFGFSVLVLYAVWATFWGWKVVWPKWRSFVGSNMKSVHLYLVMREAGRRRSASAFSPYTIGRWLAIALLFVYIPFIAAYVYGCLGGGIYQYLKARRIARGP